MKKILKDLGISIIIAIITFYMVYLINGSVLHGDLYNQGLDFLEYYKNEFNILSGDWIYNWSIGIGDNNFALIIYYLLSPFNIMLKCMKNFDMIDILPIFLTIKIVFMIYFSSLYFEKVVSKRYKWIGVLIYISNYNIMVYGNYQIMWMDTFIFLPLVLLGIEKVLNKESYWTYIVSLFMFIITDYYLAALIIPHIAIYGIIRYIIINDKRAIIKFIKKMVLVSLVSVLLAGVVLIPAIDITLSSAKEINVIPEFTMSFSRLLNIFKFNFIGSVTIDSNSYISIIGMICILAYMLHRKVGREKIYFWHIGLLILAIFSDKINYIFNFAYIPVGGNYRYNLFLNIYIAIITCNYLMNRVYVRDRSVKKELFIISIAMALILIFVNGNNVYVKYINILFIILYLCVLSARKIAKRGAVNLITIILIFEVAFNCYYIYKDINLQTKDVRSEYSYILEYVKDKYGEYSRIELSENDLLNLYTSQNIMGVSSYHSLINSNYENLGKVFTNTNNSSVRNNIKGRNVIAQLIGTQYYISYYNYCPYMNSELIEKVNECYIFKISNEELKYFSIEDIENEKLSDNLIEKDALLYSNIYISEHSVIEDSKEDKEKSKKSIDEIVKEKSIDNNEYYVEESGEYYVVITDAERYSEINIQFSINDNDARGVESIDTIKNDKESNDVFYLGYLNKDDIIKFKNDLALNGKFVIIDGEYIQDSIESMNSIKIEDIIRTNRNFISEFELQEEGYVLFPIIYDHNWRIADNDTNIDSYLVDGGFMALKLDKGHHEINMTYVNKSLFIGIGCSSITLIIILFIGMKKYFKKFN